MGYRKFIWLGFGGLTFALLLVYVACFIIDPFGINNQVRVEGVNKIKPEFFRTARKWKVLNAHDRRPSTVFLGSSRIECLQPEQHLHDREEAYNFGMSGGTTREMLELLKFAHRSFDIDTAYYALDFFAVTNLNPPTRPGFEQEMLNVPAKVQIEKHKTYLSLHCLKNAYRCVRSNRADPLGSEVKYQYNAYGSRTNDWHERNLQEQGSSWWYDQFDTELKRYEEIYNRDTLRFDTRAFANVVLLQEYCKAHDIVLCIFISPVHAKQLELLLNSGLKSDYFTFLHLLSKTGSYRYFGGCNGYPADDDLYWDSQHARKQMFNQMAPHLYDNAPGVGLFGVQVTGDNIEQLLRTLEAECAN